MALPATFQTNVRRLFLNDIHFVAVRHARPTPAQPRLRSRLGREGSPTGLRAQGAFSEEERALAMPWAAAVLMNFPLATVQIVTHNKVPPPPPPIPLLPGQVSSLPPYYVNTRWM